MGFGVMRSMGKPVFQPFQLLPSTAHRLMPPVGKTTNRVPSSPPLRQHRARPPVEASAHTAWQPRHVQPASEVLPRHHRPSYPSTLPPLQPAQPPISATCVFWFPNVQAFSRSGTVSRQPQHPDGDAYACREPCEPTPRNGHPPLSADAPPHLDRFQQAVLSVCLPVPFYRLYPY